MDIVTNSSLKKRYPKSFFVNLHLRKIANEAELKEGFDLIELDINRVITDFRNKTGRDIKVIKIKEIKGDYKLLIEVI